MTRPPAPPTGGANATVRATGTPPKPQQGQHKQAQPVPAPPARRPAAPPPGGRPQPSPAASPTGIGSRAAGGLCRVTIAGPRTRVDLTVPSSIPLAHLLPAMLRYAIPDRGAAGGTGWLLTRLDGATLDAALSLHANAVREGEVLVLRPASERRPPPLYDDVVEVIGHESVENPWGTKQTRAACATFAILAVLGAATAAAISGAMLGGVLTLAAAALLVAGGTGLARAAGETGAATVTAALAAPLAAAGAVRLLGDPWGAPHLLLASAAVLVVAVLGALLVGAGDATFAAIAMIGILGLLAGVVAVLSDGSAAWVAALIAPLALAGSTALPTLALRLARLPRPQLPKSAEDIANVPGQVELERASRQVAIARQLLTGLSAGVHAVVAAGIAVLAFDGTWARVLAAVLAVLVALRARLFRERAQVITAVCTAALALVGVIIGYLMENAGDDGALLGIALPTLLAIALCGGLAGVVHGKRPPSPRAARSLDLAELVLLLSVAPLALAVWEVYSALLELGA
ncbi:type VII secretion integral membrane protein EccD [Herbihabitans rhizosphaerae]|uniref:Type VII secretion integral membrane protein EccD n=1 Tax=Herbihabitans rhizosphaerae TaxID=1872711 RepID=A0A4Q7L0T5_9PSEU|nr:type VII secretion integral membrane protein EccD [Herbihabitans rhizosphaerae]RZS43088.1 type VII secretion integral membrane protein EccD [Herbihabitans rhizosphaerae]